MSAGVEDPAVEAAAPYTHSQRLTLLACILGSSAAFLDGTIVNVALPAIRASVHGGLVTQEWVVDGYLLMLGSLLLIGGSLGDVFGRRRIFAIGVSGFGLASLCCAIAPDAGLLIAARALQGIAAALLVPSNLALIMDNFSLKQRAAAIGSWTAWTGIATVAGPLIGGLLVQIASWRWVFVINLPLVVVTLWLARAIPTRECDARARVDWTGGALCALGLAGVIFALIEQPAYGWGDPRVWGTMLAGCALLLIFVWWERGCANPMLPLGIFRVRNFGIGNLTTFFLYGGLSVVSFFLVVFLQQVGGYRPLVAGLATLPVSILMFLLARRFGALADRFGPRLFMGIGPLVATAGLLLSAERGCAARLSARRPARGAPARARVEHHGRAAHGDGPLRRAGGALGPRVRRQQRCVARGWADRDRTGWGRRVRSLLLAGSTVVGDVRHRTWRQLGDQAGGVGDPAGSRGGRLCDSPASARARRPAGGFRQRLSPRRHPRRWSGGSRGHPQPDRDPEPERSSLRTKAPTRVVGPDRLDDS